VIDDRSTVDWKRLRPNLVVAPGDPLYAWRPDTWNGGERLAALLAAGMGPLVIAGPPGSGKSTELAAAASELAKNYATLLVPLDPLVSGQPFDARRLAVALTHAVARDLTGRGVELAPEVQSALRLSTSPWLGAQYDGIELLLHLLRAARSLPGSQPVALLIDGLDKCTAATARAIASDLRPLAREAPLALVLAPSAVTGPEAHELLRSFRLCPVGAVPISLDLPGTSPMDAWKFLSAIALQRLGWAGWPGNVEKYAYKAALCSAGLPRSFLLFLQDVAGYSGISGHGRVTRAGMRMTYRLHHESAIRLLCAGDLPDLERAKGTNGSELPLAAKLRLLDQGLVLEYEGDGKIIVQPHPILTEYGVSPIADGAFL